MNVQRRTDMRETPLAPTVENQYYDFDKTQVTIKSLKMTADMDEGPAWSAKVFLKGKLVGTASYQGTGGPVDIDFTSQQRKDDWEGHLACLPNVPSIYFSDGHSLIGAEAGFLVGLIVDQEPSRQYIQRKTKDSIVFQLKDDAEFRFRAVPCVNTQYDTIQRTLKNIMDTHGDNIFHYYLPREGSNEKAVRIIPGQEEAAETPKKAANKVEKKKASKKKAKVNVETKKPPHKHAPLTKLSVVPQIK